MTVACFLVTAALASLPMAGQYRSANPQVASLVSQVSEERIVATLKKLESFRTRYLLSSQDDPVRGIGAARKWIFEELKSYNPRLEVSYEQYRVKKIEAANSRVPRDVDLYNIVAVLPGKVHPELRVMVTAHYDTIALAGPTGVNTAGANTTPAVADPNADAPGVTDDASGIACILELARIFSQHDFDKTLVFAAFAGEEEGLLGSTLHAAKAKRDGLNIEAVLNNDIIGTDTSGSGRADNRRVSVFSEDPIDSAPRTVARYVKEIGERYVPSMKVDLVFRQDRVGRGGDHTPFTLEGFGGVRLSSTQEDYAHQHTPADTFEFTSPPYITRVTRVNAAVAASLALAPRAPEEFKVTRGDSRYDGKLTWKLEKEERDLAGYVILMRATTAPYWERETFVGKATEYMLPDVSIDEQVFGVKAVDTDGNESLVSPFVAPPRVKRVVAVE